MKRPTTTLALAKPAQVFERGRHNALGDGVQIRLHHVVDDAPNHARNSPAVSGSVTDINIPSRSTD
jgi:hypothetical protein